MPPLTDALTPPEANLHLLTFLGTGRYLETTYEWRGKRHWTPLATIAIARILRPARVLVALTPEAEAHANWALLRESLDGEGIAHEPVIIDRGRNEAELWQIFSSLAERLAPGQRVVMDVTHGFRSLPLLGLLMAGYLHALGRVELEHLLYGAYESRSAENVSPIFDLGPFVDLILWAGAASQFTQTRDARPLARLLAQANRRWFVAPATAEGSLPSALSSLAGMLSAASEAMLSARPRELHELAPRLLQQIERAGQEAPRFAPPFSLLLDEVRQELAWTGGQDGEFATHLGLIQQCLDAHWTAQAVLLMREWVVNWIARKRGCAPYPHEQRAAIEGELNDATGSEGRPEAAQADVRAAAGVWDRLVSLRNDVAHCGMREQPLSSAKIAKQARECFDRIQELERRGAAV